ncbi:hypothetical protein [Aureimonas glaciei]|nr:hypothetical protein [Aureimonas glaciei]
MTTPRPIWTEDEVTVLRSLVDLGKNDAEISDALGTRTQAQVSTKRCALGLPTTRPPGRPRTYDLAAIEAIRARIVAGEHVNSVAADLGLKPRTVYARLRLLTA